MESLSLNREEAGPNDPASPNITAHGLRFPPVGLIRSTADFLNAMFCFYLQTALPFAPKPIPWPPRP